MRSTTATQKYLNLDQVEDIESSGLGTIVSVMKHLGDGRKMNLRAYPNR